MKKFLLVTLALICGGAAYCSLPLTSVAILTVTLADQKGQKITKDASATYLDADGTPIVKVTPDTRGSWDNNIQWWSHSSHATSNLRPADAKRATSVMIEARNCDAATLPVKLERTYEALSLAPHGGGAAYLIFKFEQSVVLQCS